MYDTKVRDLWLGIERKHAAWDSAMETDLDGTADPGKDILYAWFQVLSLHIDMSNLQ